MKYTMLSLAAAAVLASPALVAMDEEAGRPVVLAGTLIRGVTIPSAFKGLDGKTQPAGLYDMNVQQGAQGILIGLFRNGKRVAEVQGRFFSGVVSRFSAGGQAAQPPGASSQGNHLQVHFDASSKVSFPGGGGTGKISCSNNLHPGGANPGSISFLLPAVQVPGK